MDVSVIGGMLSEQAKINTLEKVNVSLIKTQNDQAEQQVTQILESVAPDTTKPEGSKGNNINIAV
jgi:hypothetical protein